MAMFESALYLPGEISSEEWLELSGIRSFLTAVPPGWWNLLTPCREKSGSGSLSGPTPSRNATAFANCSRWDIT